MSYTKEGTVSVQQPVYGLVWGEQNLEKEEFSQSAS